MGSIYRLGARSGAESPKGRAGCGGPGPNLRIWRIGPLGQPLQSGGRGAGLSDPGAPGAGQQFQVALKLDGAALPRTPDNGARSELAPIPGRRPGLSRPPGLADPGFLKKRMIEYEFPWASRTGWAEISTRRSHVQHNSRGTKRICPGLFLLKHQVEGFPETGMRCATVGRK